MAKEEIESKLRELEQEQARLRGRLGDLEDIVQNTPGSHSSGTPSAEVMKAEQEIQTIVLDIVELDRKRQELSVAMSLNR
ncbi:MAG TPA: hypothetical protein VJX74_00940 [Blastocatellia bacterium]|nr:hypothetical protein [Blastocatellia bacterium]